MHMKIFVQLMLASVLLLASAAPAQSPRAKSAKKDAAASPLAEAIAERNARRLETLGADAKPADIKAASADAQRVLDWTAAFADPVKDAEAFRAAALGARAASQLGSLPADARADAVKTMQACPNLAATLLFIVDSAEKGGDNIKGVYETLRGLTAKFGEKKLEAYPELTAAMCVVHDAPLVTRVNENLAYAASPEEIFAYYTTNEKQMRFGIKGIPAEVLVYVVDVCAPIDEMQWALQRYARSPIAPLYQQIRYDSEHLAGAPKKVTAAGFSLPNILKHGGVCADQAHYAATVGKACGVPSVVCTGRDDTVGHAWLGTLVVNRGKPAWDFETGRYPEYQNVRGTTIEPRSRTFVPDGYVTILTEGMQDPVGERQAAIALSDAAARLLKRPSGGSPFPPEPGLLGGAIMPAAPDKPRAATLESALTLLEAAVRLCPAETNAWYALTEVAKSPEMTTAQRSRWAGAVDELCGKRTPDFAYSMYAALVDGVKDHRQRAGLWDKLVPMFSTRPDLAAAAKLSAGDAWEQASEKEKAWQAYQSVVKTSAGVGPAVLPALTRCEKLLRDINKPGEIVPMYERAWQATAKPRGEMGGPFATQSNWYRVGQRFMQAAEAAGNAAKAKQVRAQLDQVK